MNRFKHALQDGSRFAVVAELVAGRGYSLDPVRRFLSDHQADGAASIPPGFAFAGVTLPQNPGGVSSLDPSDMLAQLAADGLLDALDAIPHLSCKDHNQAALHSMLVGFRQRGVNSVLALTGDVPVSAKGVFDLEAVGLLRLIGRMNRQELLATRLDGLADVLQIFAGAAVSPFKYTEPSQMQQYYKMEKKVAAGARFLITQVGWDWKKALELKLYLEEADIGIPVLGNVYFLTTANAAPRLMNTGKLPGCYVSDALLERLKQETKVQHLERCAQQVAMYRALGYAGIDLGGVQDYGTLCRIMGRAAEIGDGWTAVQDNLCWPAADPFYLYRQTGARADLGAERRTLHERWFDFMHRTLLDPEHTGFHHFRRMMALAGAERNPGGIAGKAFFALERAVKHAAFGCEECGDCYLAENFGYCTMGGCAKGLANSPCGDAKVDGTCGNKEGVVCRGEQIYRAAKARPGGLELLRKTINEPRNTKLAHGFLNP